MREAKWTDGAYTNAPQIWTTDGRTIGRAAVECWRGTPEEFLAVIDSIADQGKQTLTVTAQIDWRDGTRTRVNGLTNIRSVVETVPTVKSVEINVKPKSGGWQATVRAEQSVPGVRVEAAAPDPGVVTGLVKAAFARAMIGYVDRLGSWRTPVLALLAVGAPLVMNLLLPRESAWARNAAWLAVPWAAFVVFVLGSRLLVRKPFDLVRTIEREPITGSVFRLAATSGRRFKRWALSTVLGALALGVLGNLISGALPGIAAAVHRWLEGSGP